jgi:hypothetical protein
MALGGAPKLVNIRTVPTAGPAHPRITGILLSFPVQAVWQTLYPMAAPSQI